MWCSQQLVDLAAASGQQHERWLVPCLPLLLGAASARSPPGLGHDGSAQATSCAGDELTGSRKRAVPDLILSV